MREAVPIYLTVLTDFPSESTKGINTHIQEVSCDFKKCCKKYKKGKRCKKCPDR